MLLREPILQRSRGGDRREIPVEDTGHLVAEGIP
jgi:hypothetical protein